MFVVMVVKSGVTDDARLRREAGALAAAGHRVIVIGDRPGPDHPIDGVELRWARAASERSSWADRSPLRTLIRWMLLPNHRRRDDRAFVQAAASRLAELKPDVVHAHDLNGLQAATATSVVGRGLVYDAHECWTGRRQTGRPDPLGCWLDGRRERRLGGGADVVVTVSEELAVWLRGHRGLGDVRVVRNTASASTGRPTAPRAAHYGGRVDEERDLETAALGMQQVDGVDLVVRGGGDPSVIATLQRRGVDVLDAIPADQLAGELEACGVGLVTLSGGSLNHDVALPNKLFLAVQSGVPVVAADLPALRRIVTEHGIGTLYRPGDPASFASAVRAVVADYDRFCDAVAAAKPALSWDADAARLIGLYDEAFGR